jgi:hypothetical protein
LVKGERGRGKGKGFKYMYWIKYSRLFAEKKDGYKTHPLKFHLDSKTVIVLD